jgi:hypothetical protein
LVARAEFRTFIKAARFLPPKSFTSYTCWTFDAIPSIITITMPCVLRRDPSIILSTKQAQDLTRCCSGPSMSLSQPADPSFTSTPPASSTSASAELVARIEEWLYKEDPVLPTSFVDLPRINSVVYPLTTANLWYLQGILISKEGISC